MGNEFEAFVEFVGQTTGRHPKFAESFKDIFIYVPSGKTPPEVEEPTSNSPRTVSIKKYMNNLNKDFVDRVYHEDWNQLEHHIGPQLLRFCLTECILAKKTKTGAFMVSKLTNLRTKIAPFEPPPKITIPYCRTVEEHLSVAKENKAVPDLKHLMCPTELEITTDHMLRHNSKSQRFPPSHTLMRQSGSPRMSSQVISLRVGVWQVDGYEDCIQPLELILDKLSKSHKSYAYETALERLIISEYVKSDGTYNFGNQIPVPVLKKYFGDIMRLVVPKELLGSHRNRNAVTKSICELLDAPRGQAIGLETYISRMKISDIPWLEGVKNTDTQWCLIAKLVKWLYHEFILELFSTQLYITVTDSNKKVYFKQTDWQKLTTQFWRDMKSQEVIARSDALVTRLFCEGRWILFPKKTGVRPIMSPIGARRQSTKTALCYLQQLYVTKYGASGNQIFLEKWRNLVENLRNDNKIMYLVCCDIQYAYESIDQKKLFEIVESLAASTGSELCRKWYRVARNLQAVKSESTKLKHYFAHPELELPVASNSIFACASEKVDKISKEAVLREIRRNILNQNLLILGQRYVLQKGIAQGAMLSSVLCDIYYTHMEETNLSEFRDQGFLYRYVDDFLFVTEDKALAERFLQRVNAGFPEYNCSFNAAKTRSNLLPTKDPITFLGFNIDPHTFEVTPDYPKSTRYTTLLSKPRYDIMKTFYRRLSNLATLKLDGLILDCKINSRETIIHNMECVFKRQAERCLWLLQALFDNIPRQLKRIFWIVKSTNLQIIRRMQRYFLANGYSFEELIPSLWTISWSSYRQVFGKKQHIHAHFRNLFLHYMKISKESIAM